MTREDIEELFDYKYEKKSTDEERKEKCKRRINTVIIKVATIRSSFYEGKSDLFRILNELNCKYSAKISFTDLENIKLELLQIINLISKNEYEQILQFNFENYSKFLNSIDILYVKSLGRLENMKQLTRLFLSFKISETLYKDDLYDQESFFTELLHHLETITPENAWIYILRYDLKTIKKQR